MEQIGSVKSLDVIEKATPHSTGRGAHTLNPVFSVFDFGTLAPKTPIDNSTVAVMAAFNFELLQEKGIRTHYQGISHGGDLKKVSELPLQQATQSATLGIELANVLKPDFDEEKGAWDYSMFENPTLNNFILPLECIMRDMIGEKSSIWRRIENGELSSEQLAYLGLDTNSEKRKIGLISEGKEAFLDYSTKYEPEDRYLTPEEARLLVHLGEHAFKNLEKITKVVNINLREHTQSRGFEREDGKIEYMVKRDSLARIRFFLADAVGTWHEDRILYKEQAISKQLLRNEMERLNPGWVESIKAAKKEAKERGLPDFRELMGDMRDKYVLPDREFITAYNNLMRAATNLWVGKPLYLFDSNRGIQANDNSLDRELERRIGDFQNLKAA